MPNCINTSSTASRTVPKAEKNPAVTSKKRDSRFHAL